jgi:hypothetical protein
MMNAIQRLMAALRGRKPARVEASDQTVTSDDVVAKHGLSYGSPPDMIAPDSKVMIEIMKSKRRGGGTSWGGGT